jgi:hypothetical protein
MCPELVAIPPDWSASRVILQSVAQVMSFEAGFNADSRSITRLIGRGRWETNGRAKKEGDVDWVEILKALPKWLLTFGGALACLSLVALVAATADSTYRTHKPFRVAGYLFGYAADEPSDVDKLKSAINEQFEKLKSGIVKDEKAIVSNGSTKTGAGYQYDQIGGRCPDGESVVGIQPMPSDGGSALRFQCGKLPELRVP